MELFERICPVSAGSLYEDFARSPNVHGAVIHRFEGVDGCDVYNPSVPFTLDGVTYIAGRVEQRDSERSRVMFFRRVGGVWELCRDAMTLELQDPFVTWIKGELILGGVRVDWDEETGLAKAWYTDFYRGTSLQNLRYFASGPHHMKDVRLAELSDGRIGVFSRPQGPKVKAAYGCVAKVGFTIVEDLEHLTAEAIENAPFLEGLFLPEEWGGCNQVSLLSDGCLGVVGHIAWGEGPDENSKTLHYYGMAFVLNPITREMSQPRLIATRDCFPEGSAKQPRLRDVTFTSGILRNGDGTATVFTGLSDAQVGSAVIEDPFTQWENRLERV
ncbi:MAG: DUF1861 family protein [Faecousia sp.]